MDIFHINKSSSDLSSLILVAVTESINQLTNQVDSVLFQSHFPGAQKDWFYLLEGYRAILCVSFTRALSILRRVQSLWPNHSPSPQNNVLMTFQHSHGRLWSVGFTGAKGSWEYNPKVISSQEGCFRQTVPHAFLYSWLIPCIPYIYIPRPS